VSFFVTDATIKVLLGALVFGVVLAFAARFQPQGTHKAALVAAAIALWTLPLAYFGGTLYYRFRYGNAGGIVISTATFLKQFGVPTVLMVFLLVFLILRSNWRVAHP